MLHTVAIAITMLIPAQKAPLPEVQFVGNWDEAREQARLRNAVIFLSFHQDGEQRCRLMRKGTFQNPTFVKIAAEEVICVVAHLGVKQGTEHEPEEVRDERTGAIVYRCPLYQGIVCTQHQTLYRELNDRYEYKLFPGNFFLDPNGEILVGSKGFGPRGDIAVTKLREAQKKLDGKTLRLSEYRKWRKQMDKAEGLLVDEEFNLAIAAFEKAGRNKRLTEPLKAKVKEALDDLNQIGLQMIDEGKKRHAEDAQEGMKILKKVRHEFKGLEASDKARAAIAEIEGDEE